MPFDKEGCTSGTDKSKRGGVLEGPARPRASGTSRGGGSSGPLTGSWSPSGRGTSRLRFPMAFSSKRPLWRDTLWMAQSGLPLTVSPRRCDLRWPLSAPVGCFSWCLHRFVRHLGRVSRPSFSREERETPGAPPPTLWSSWDRRRPRGGQGRSGGLCAPGADLGGGSLHPGGCGREARPHPSGEESSGWDAEGSGHWPSPLGS